jgi:hypothetical protein
LRHTDKRTQITPRAAPNLPFDGFLGSFDKVSHAYLPLYVNEFEFRYNNRKNPDIFGAAIRAC